MSENEGLQQRVRLFQYNERRLAQLAYQMTSKGFSLGDFYIVCIDVDADAWRPLVEEIMPGHDWQQYRDRGEMPMLRGAVGTEYLEMFRQYVPAIVPALTAPVTDGCARVIVMAGSGATVFSVIPTMGRFDN
jgi:hypothetical protein